jgi:hypothetical protein
MWKESRIQNSKTPWCYSYVTSKNVKQLLYRPLGFQDVKAAISEDNWHMKVVMLSAPRTGPLYPQVLIGVWGSVGPRDTVRPERFSMKKSNDTIENRSHDRPACSVVPQLTTPPSAPRCKYISYVVHISECSKYTNSARQLDRPWTWR